MLYTNTKLLEQLKRHEGSVTRDGKHVAYLCPAGKLTIGYGHNLDANPLPGIDKDSELTEKEAEKILSEDVRLTELSLLSALPWVAGLNPARQAVLINMAFNMGINSLLGFRNTLSMVVRGDCDGAASGMLNSRWASQVGRRAVELSRQMRTGKWKEPS